MGDYDLICARTLNYFSDVLSMKIPSLDTNLIDEGYLDSLAFVDLLVFLQEEFGFQIENDKLEIRDFRSISNIGLFVEKQHELCRQLLRVDETIGRSLNFDPSNPV